MAHRARLTFILVSLAACSPSPILVDIPFGVEDRSAIVVIEQGINVTVKAISIARRDESPILDRIDSYSGNPPLILTTFLFEDALDELGISHGDLEPVGDGEASQELTGWREVQELRLSLLGDETWAPVSRPSGAASMVRLPVTKPCVPLVFERFPLDGLQYMAGMIALTATSALMIAYDDDDLYNGTFYEVTMAGAKKLRTALPDVIPRSMVLGRDGRIYIAGSSRVGFYTELYSGNVRDGFEPVPLRTPMRPSGWMEDLIVPTDPSDSATLYAYTEYGDVYRFEDEEWFHLGATVQGTFGNEGRMVWLGRDDILAIAPNGGGIFHLKDGISREEETAVTPDVRRGLDQMTALAFVPGYGIFSGSDTGYMFERTDRGWSGINDKALIAEISIRDFSLLPSGAMAIGGGYGSIEQYHRDYGLCRGDGEVYFISNNAHSNLLVPLREGVLVGGVENITMSERVIFAGALREDSR
jgi:hypothetical protein